MMMTTMKTRTRGTSIVSFLAAFSLVLSFHSCASTSLNEARIHASFLDLCSDDHGNQAGWFYECGHPAGRCICDDHTAYCDPSSPSLPVLNDEIHVLNLCTNYFESLYSIDENTLQSSDFFSSTKNLTELRSSEFFSATNNVTELRSSEFFKPTNNVTELRSSEFFKPTNNVTELRSSEFFKPTNNVTELRSSETFFSATNNVTELRIIDFHVRSEDFDLLANITKVRVSCFFYTVHYETTWVNFFLIPNLRQFRSWACDWIPPSSHSGMMKSPLQSVFIDSCTRWTTIDLKVFEAFENLTSISVTISNVFRVQSAALPALEELVLYQNELKSFPQTCDTHNRSLFPSLKRISLASNDIDHIGGSESATCLPEITEIDVRENPITSVRKGVFDAESCPELETINLGHDGVFEKIPLTIFTEDFVFANPSIKNLNLTNSKWNFALDSKTCTLQNCVARNTFANSSLTHLNLDGSDFFRVDPDRFFGLFADLKNLTHLSLRDSNFELPYYSTDDRFCAFNLEYLRVSDTTLRHCFIPSNMDEPDALCNNSTIKTFAADNAATLKLPSPTDIDAKMQTISCVDHYKFYILQFALAGPTIEQLSFRYNNLDFGKRCLDSERRCVLPASFENKPNLKVLLLDQSDFRSVDTERFVSLFGKLTNLESLSISASGIRYVSAEMFRNFPRLRDLDLSNNRLNTLSSQTFLAQPSLTTLFLDGNDLAVVPEGLLSLDQRKGIQRFFFYGNPLECSCGNRWLRTWLLSDPDLFAYTSRSYMCTDDPTKSVANYTMPDQACMLEKDAGVALIITSTVLITVLTGFLLLFRYRWRFRLLLYYALSNRDKKRARRRNYVYDVFVSYDQGDFHWVRHQLMPELEDRLGLRLCIHQRDFIPGHYIVTNIAQAVEHSKKVLMVFSRHFVLSRWCQFEVDFCLSHAIENRDSLLIVCLDNVTSDETLLTGAMKAALSTMTYIQWVKRRDAIHFFWERVGQSLRDVRPRDREAGRRRQQEVLDLDARVRIEMQVMDF